MELSLFSRDVIAMSTAIALSHDMFDARADARRLRQDRARPADRRAVASATCRRSSCPAGPMPSGLPNDEKAQVRQLYAEGKVGREELLEAEAASYHSARHLHVLRHRELQPDADGGHGPAPAGRRLRQPGHAAARRADRRGRAPARAGDHRARATSYTPVGEIVDEKAIVNGVRRRCSPPAARPTTRMHLVAIAARRRHHARPGTTSSDLSAVVPLLARDLPQRQGRREPLPRRRRHRRSSSHTLLDAGLLHDDVRTVAGHGLWRYTDRAAARRRRADLGGRARAQRSTPTCCAPADDPFAPDGGLRMLDGNLGRAVIKISAVKPEHRVVEAPALVFDDQDDFLPRSRRGELDGRDFVAVIRYQGPARQRHARAAQADARRSACCRTAATGSRSSPTAACPARRARCPAAIHVTPEAAVGGPLARVRDGDLVTRRRRRRHARPARRAVPSSQRAAHRPRAATTTSGSGTGRELFAAFRAAVGPADPGASVFPGRRLPARRCPMSSRLSPLLDRVPVVPVVVVDDLDHAVPLARALVAGRAAGDRADAAHAGRARRDRARSPPRCRRSWSAPARRRRRRRPSTRSPRARSSSSPRAPRPPCSPRCTTPGCRSCPAPPPSRRCCPCSRPATPR